MTRARCSPEHGAATSAAQPHVGAGLVNKQRRVARAVWRDACAASGMTRGTCGVGRLIALLPMNRRGIDVGSFVLVIVIVRLGLQRRQQRLPVL